MYEGTSLGIKLFRRIVQMRYTGAKSSRYTDQLNAGINSNKNA